MAERSRNSLTSVLEWGCVAILARFFDRVPESLAYALGEAAAGLAFRVDARHRAIAAENLARAFPGRYTSEELHALVREVFLNLGRTAVDVARSHRLLRPEHRHALEVEGFEHLDAARRRGKGVLALTAHLGPWELMILTTPVFYEPIHVVVRPLDNPRLDDLLTTLRERGGSQLIRKREAVRAILQTLRRGKTVGIMIDQHISEREGVVVPFFGRPASTASAPALIAIRSGAAVVPAGIIRLAGRGRYRIRIFPEVEVRRSGDLKADLVENTARFNQAIEAMIREHPDHWFWVHRRWKTTQPLDPRFEPAMLSSGSRP